MNVSCVELARRLGVPPLQVLVELAAMNQPWTECWPGCDEGFAATLVERRRVRMGLAPRSPGLSMPESPMTPASAELPVSEAAGAILDKLLRKSYGLKSVRVFTLLKKWIHQASETDIKELIQRGNLEWTDAGRTAVNLVASKLADTERIVDLYRRRTATPLGP